jgi:2-polyprenyl-6-methoxyphenol hydroxylase-like FAD-dependent oxidoreductase
VTAADVIIVGGGIAGSTLALLLGRAGLQIELYEQHHFPRDKPCAEGLMPAGAAVLDRLGVPGTLQGARFRGIRYHGFGHCLTGQFPDADGTPSWGRAIRRLHLDAALFAAAAGTPGVTAFEGARIDDPVIEAGRVRGVAVGGQVRRARLVVAADGPRSIVRRRLGLDRVAWGRPRIGVRRHYRLAAGQTVPDQVEIFVAGDHEIYVTPLPGREISVAALCDQAALTLTRGPVVGRAGSVEQFFTRAMTAHAPLPSGA